MSTAEVEAALMAHPAVAEAAVVSRPHQLKGECLYCFVTLKNNREFSQTLAEELKNLGKTGMEGGSVCFEADYYSCLLNRTIVIAFFW